MAASVSFDRASAALLVERLTKVYADGTRALDEPELRIPSGCFFELLGPNGAGKTTLIGAVSGLVRAPARRIFVFGHDAVTDLTTRLLAGVAPQEVHLDRFLTAREVLAYHGRYFGLPRLEAEQRADELLEVFDLKAKASTKPSRLSGGMRRRLVIARALVHRPRLLILDEPTAGVDLELRHELWRFLRRLHGEHGLTVLLTPTTSRKRRPSASGSPSSALAGSPPREHRQNSRSRSPGARRAASSPSGRRRSCRRS